MRNPIDWLARRVLPDGIDYGPAYRSPEARLAAMPWQVRHPIERALRMTALPVPATTAQRVTAAELARDQADHELATAPFEWSDFEGGVRPATKEGREGRD